MASAVPLYQLLFWAVTAGVNTYRPPCLRPKSHHLEELKCSCRLLALYWVSTATFWMWELDMLLKVKSMLR